MLSAQSKIDAMLRRWKNRGLTRVKSSCSATSLRTGTKDVEHGATLATGSEYATGAAVMVGAGTKDVDRGTKLTAGAEYATGAGAALTVDKLAEYAICGATRALAHH